MTPVVINQSYAGQRISGQQRYAAEIAARLPEDQEFVRMRPQGFWAVSTARVWAWVQVVLPLVAGSSVVLSMTARAPLWSRRQVVVVHDLFVLDHPEWFSRKYVWTHAPLLRAQIKAAKAVVAVSQPVADQVAALRSDEVAVAPNAPSDVFALEDARPSEVLAGRGIAAGSYFLAVGNRDPRKNLVGLAAAYSLLSEEERAEHPLVLIGGGAGIFRDQEIDWPVGAVDAGYVEDDELRRLYRDAGAVVFVSLAEGFGLPLVEAAAAGARSFVISDLPVFRWICGENAQYVDPVDAVDVARGMRAGISEEHPSAFDMGRFTWETSARVVADTCRRVAQKVSDR
jgi:glycosyltransferase involved in cell wall biosynthesis